MRMAARRFIERLQPNDLVGLYVFPLGTPVDPTTNHSTVAAALERLTGARATLATRFALSDLEMLEMSGAMASRICGGSDPACVREVGNDAAAMQRLRVQETTQGLRRLRDAMRGLAASPIRKTIVLLSAGIVTGQFDDIPEEVGREAALANGTVYVLFTDTAFLEDASASSRRQPQIHDNHARQSALLSQPLDRLAGISGGTVFRVIQGGGEFGFDRILRETSAFYRLGVETEERDRDGRGHAIRIQVKRRGLTVRGRQWVVVPKAVAVGTVQN
jgi:hypothetical protein